MGIVRELTYLGPQAYVCVLNWSEDARYMCRHTRKLYIIPGTRELGGGQTNEKMYLQVEAVQGKPLNANTNHPIRDGPVVPSKRGDFHVRYIVLRRKDSLTRIHDI